MPPPTLVISSDEVGQHYDLLDRFYREFWGEAMHHGLWINEEESLHEAQQTLIQKAAEKLTLEPGQEVCDVGCGYGLMARLLAASHGVRVIGITNSACQYRYAQALVTPALPVKFRLEDWQQTALSSGLFDRVLAIESLEHMQDQERALQQIARVLKPGGRLVICAWMHGPSPSFRERRWLVDPVCRSGCVPAFTETATLGRRLTDAGFHILENVDLSREAAPTWLRLGMHLLKRLLRRPSLIRQLWPVRRKGFAFGLAALRLWFGYHRGTFCYAMYIAEKPSRIQQPESVCKDP